MTAKKKEGCTVPDTLGRTRSDKRGLGLRLRRGIRSATGGMDTALKFVDEDKKLPLHVLNSGSFSQSHVPTCVGNYRAMCENTLCKNDLQIIFAG